MPEDGSLKGDCAPKQAKPITQHVPSSSPLSSPPAESSSDEQALQTKFTLPPAPQVAAKTLPNGRKRAHSLVGDSSGAVTNVGGRDSNAIGSNPDQSSKIRRTRSSTGGNKLEEKGSDNITSKEEDDLITRYTDIFLDHMHNVERRLPNALVDRKTVASKVRNVGPKKKQWHPSITGLHKEFKDYAVNPKTDTPVRYALEDELLKFEEALPYWSPKCKGLSRQKDRLVMINKMVQHIADGQFNKDDYKEAYDPYNEL